LVLKVPGQPEVLFKLKLAGSPNYSDDFGSWQRADFIAPPDGQPPRRAGDGDDYDIRYRVRDPSRPAFVQRAK
jgi:hypothetical protein